MQRAVLIAIPYAWLLALFLVPFVIVFKISLSDIALAIPPYTPTLDDGLRTFFAGLDEDLLVSVDVFDVFVYRIL